MEVTRNAYKIQKARTEETYNGEIILQSISKISIESVDRIRVVRNEVQWWLLVKMIPNLLDS
jgi:hypothetical protein